MNKLVQSLLDMLYSRHLRPVADGRPSYLPMRPLPQPPHRVSQDLQITGHGGMAVAPQKPRGPRGLPQRKSLPYGPQVRLLRVQ